jgi:hypothetical protein
MTRPAADSTARPAEPEPERSTRRRIIGMTIAVWVVAAVLSATLNPQLIAVAGAFAIGWSHLVGRCGTSHFGTLTPFVNVPGLRRRWTVTVLAYVSSGTLTSGIVGVLLATAGAFLVPANLRTVALGVVLLLACVAAAGDLGLIPWRLPQANLQTRQAWGYKYRPLVAATLWGLGLGLTFATVYTFSGVWLVLTLPIAMGKPILGVLVLVSHWLGRATPIIFGRLLLTDAGRTEEVLDGIASARPVFRTTNVFGIGLMILSVALLLAAG